MAEIKVINLSVERALGDLANKPLLSIEEELELIESLKKGDEKAIEKLKQGNARFVVAVAKKYLGQGLTLEELMEEGYKGLMTAAMKYDEARGFKFISYAVWHIRQSILMALKED